MKKIILIITIFASFFTVGCKKGFLDINSNPNQSTTTTPELVLPAALVNTAARVGNPFGTFSFVGGWVGYTAISSGYALSTNDFSTYNVTADFGDVGVWQGIYDNLADYYYVEQQAHATGKSFYEGIGKIMKAYNYQILVDLYNSIPYTQALQGTSSITPKYDDGQTIYGSLLQQIDTAMILIKGAANLPSAKSDVMFARIGGDVKGNWLRFANTLKLRMLLRMSEMATKPAYFNTELAIVAADPIGFLTVDATVNPGYTNSTGKLSPFYGSNYAVNGSYSNDFWRANAYAVNFYTVNNDSRLTRVYTAQGGSTVIGNILGQGPTGSANAAIFGPGVLQSVTQDAPLMLAAESYFEQAEAVLRGYISGNPQTLYESGVTASFNALGATGATAYYQQAGNKNTNYSATTTTDEKLNLIIKQKWAALNSVTVLEPYNDYRRFLNTSHSPKPLGDLPLSVNTNRGTRHIPYRLLYPTSELKTNTANVPAGIDPQISKPFWMP